jgi:hypothetical protein
MFNYASAPIDYSHGFSVDIGRRQPSNARNRKKTAYGRKKNPTGYNGIHRRRNKHWSW